jgi:uncharacterized protein (TIGR03118 family)
MRLRTVVVTLSLALILLFTSGVARAQYQVRKLVSNQEKTAKFVDPLVVNAWGLVSSPTSPWWISDNASGWSTLYTADGTKVPLNVSIPTAGGDGPGTPTGIVFNGSQDFKIKGSAAIFIFATLDGTISGWNPAVNPNAAVVAVPSTGAVYTGLASSSRPSGNFLFAADGANNKVDIFDATFKLVGSFTDSTIPSDFGVYGIQDFGGLVYVTYASVSNGSGGFIDIFGEDGTLLKKLTNGKPLNQPWGLAIAPANFGPFSNTLLVSNNSEAGTINAFNAVTGQFVGTLKDANGDRIGINLLWGISFGSGSASNGATNQLFFTAGPDEYATGTFGVINFKP